MPVVLRALPLLLFSTACWAQDSSACQAQIEGVLKASHPVSARFIMHKKLPGITKPLESRGRVLVIPGQGLIWEVSFPYSSTIVFGPAKIGRTDETGRYSVSDSPHAAQILDAIANFDLASARSSFFISCTVKDEKAKAVVSPKSKTYADFLSEAVIEVSNVLTRLSFAQPSGSLSHISFTDHEIPAVVSSTDAELLKSVQ